MVHDGRTPHCRACAEGTCQLHPFPILEESADRLATRQRIAVERDRQLAVAALQ
jgi:hypothetical protein